MLRIRGLFSIIAVFTLHSTVAVIDYGVSNKFNAKICADKTKLFQSNTYNLKMNRPHLQYHRKSNSTLKITNTMTFEAEVSWEFIKLLCIRYYCLSNVNLDRSAKGYTLHENYGWYKLYKEPKTWNSAHTRCLEDGATLIAPKTIAAKKILLTTLHNNNVEEVWIGVHDMYIEGLFVDVKDRVYKQNHMFNSGAYNGDNKDCIFVRKIDKIEISECAQTNLPFICEFTD